MCNFYCHKISGGKLLQITIQSCYSNVNGIIAKLKKVLFLYLF